MLRRMSNVIELSDFQNSFTDIDGITQFIYDLNSCKYKNDSINCLFKNLNL